MLVRILGILLVVTGFIASLYMEHYPGDDYHSLSTFGLTWIMRGVTVLGVYLFYASFKWHMQKKINEVEQERSAKKAQCTLIIPTLEQCELRTSVYEQELENTQMGRVQMADGLYDPSRNHQVESIRQSAIVYQDPGSGERFRSNAFSMDSTTLRYHLITGHVHLYIDRFDRKQYWFEIVRE